MTGPDIGAVPPPELPPRLVDGLSFALGGSSTASPIWGRGDDVLWGDGDPFLIVGPDGVGKTTLAQRLLLALLGIGDRRVLDVPVETADDGVLYVAADRPPQSRRSIFRMLADLPPFEQAKLKNHSMVWTGPPPFDLTKTPGALSTWAREMGASHVILDSLGFIVSKLADDETGSAIAQAFATCSAEGVNVCALMHPRKANGENKKPNKIEDVYGSRWITAASGSVLSIWGTAGDPVLEVRHLKQPVAEVGPFTVELDHHAGQLRVIAGADILGRLRSEKNGVTARDIAPMFDGSSSEACREKGRRRLERFVREGHAYRREEASGEVRYFATPPPGLLETVEGGSR